MTDGGQLGRLPRIVWRKTSKNTDLVYIWHEVRPRVAGADTTFDLFSKLGKLRTLVAVQHLIGRGSHVDRIFGRRVRCVHAVEGRCRPLVAGVGVVSCMIIVHGTGDEALHCGVPDGCCTSVQLGSRGVGNRLSIPARSRSTPYVETSVSAAMSRKKQTCPTLGAEYTASHNMQHRPAASLTDVSNSSEGDTQHHGNV